MSVMSFRAKEAERGAVCAPRVEFDANGLYAHRLFAAYRHRRQPAMAVGLLAAHDGVKLFLDRLGDRAHSALAHLDFVDRANRRDLRRGSSEEGFVADVEHLAWNHLLDKRNAQVARNLHHGIAGDA